MRKATLPRTAPKMAPRFSRCPFELEDVDGDGGGVIMKSFSVKFLPLDALALVTTISSLCDFSGRLEAAKRGELMMRLSAIAIVLLIDALLSIEKFAATRSFPGRTAPQTVIPVPIESQSYLRDRENMRLTKELKSSSRADLACGVQSLIP